jgi:RNA polymerase sigma factor (sigma-70 family)
MEPLRVLLVDDHTLFRRGIESLLASRQGIKVVGDAADGCEAITLAKETMPDVILMDIDMPGCDGLEATRQIKRELPHVKIVMLTVSDDDDKLFEAIKSGARGYLLKDLEAYQLFDMLESIRRGEAPLSGLVAARILEEFTQSKLDSPQEPEPAVVHTATDELSAREIEVLELVVDGKTNKEIAEALVITENTVKNHLSNILDKLHLQNRIQLAVYAVRQGLVGSAPDAPPGPVDDR